MGLKEEYREDVQKLEKRVNARIGHRAIQTRYALDTVLPFIGLLVGFIILFGFVLEVGPTVQRYVTYANYAVATYFGLRLVTAYKLKSSETSAQTFLENHWLDVAVIVPAFSLAEEIKLASIAESSLAARLVPEATGFSLKETSVATKLTRIARLLKRSVGL